MKAKKHKKHKHSHKHKSHKRHKSGDIKVKTKYAVRSPVRAAEELQDGACDPLLQRRGDSAEQ